MDHSPEKLFLRSCLQAMIWETPLAGQECLLGGRIDWDFFIQTAQSHRALAFVAAILEKEKIFEDLEPSTRLQFQSAIGLASWENRIRMMEFEKIRLVFQEENIPAIPLKGVALTSLVYAKLPLRCMGDIDLLIRQEDLEKTEALLSKHGLYLKQLQNKWQTELLARAWGRWSFTDGTMDLDLQWNPKFLILGRWVALDWKRVWSRAQPFPEMGKNVLILSPEDQAMHLSLQILNDIENNIPLLVQILDLALVMKKYRLSSRTLLDHASTLDPDIHGLLTRLLEAVETYFLSFPESPAISKESAAFMEYFLSPILSKKIPVIPIHKIIDSPWDRLKYRAGYLFPSESSFANRPDSGIWGALSYFLQHWVRLVLKGLPRSSPYHKK